MNDIVAVAATVDCSDESPLNSGRVGFCVE